MPRERDSLVMGRVIGDVLDPFTKSIALRVSYNGREVNNGCEFRPSQVVNKPTSMWEAKIYEHFNVVVVYPDAPNPSDPNLREYLHCSAKGPILCNKPILKSTVPSYCPLHFQKAEKHMARALKKVGLNIMSTSKLAPKFHVIVAEYVRQIQHMRRDAQKVNLDNAEIEGEKIITN